MIDPTITTALIRQTWASMRLSEFMRFLKIRDQMICCQHYYVGVGACADPPTGACTGRDPAHAAGSPVYLGKRNDHLR